MVWDIFSAMAFIKDLRTALLDVGYCVGLTGSVLYKLSSEKDLDVIIYPHGTLPKGNLEGALRLAGMKRTMTKDEVQRMWLRDYGSTDTKHVEIWEVAGKRVDLFFLV
jgi:hypothetical protein